MRHPEQPKEYIEELFKQIREGHHAKADLLETLAPLLHCLTLEACRNLNVPRDYDAEILARVRVNIFKGAETFRGEQMAQLIQWAREVARNSALGFKLDLIKKMQREVALEEVPDPPSPRRDPEQVLHWRQLTAQMVKSLRAEERMIFILKAIAEFTFSEIADMLDMSRSDVQRKYAALVERLQKRFRRAL